ncbi:phage tail protein [Sphingomonas oligoaromativorans]|uniref:phage tail protein n=1 Tax=Sphingomonas oligoaromativorans TaxID=575322 RepID=UPI0014223A10|nr:tail fiber protein [Sphingomonas oligoaromativorans]NIJ33723.1 microcystin-dependent protein [Sphingomonas oligoaromativorans]
MSQPFVGEIKLFGFPFAPRGYALCNGQILPIAQNQALFSLLGTTYGGNGTVNFALPDLRSRTPMHFSSTLPQGAPVGEEAVTLTVQTMPRHMHLLRGTSTTADSRAPNGGSFANDTSTVADFYAASTNLIAISPQTIGLTGGSQPHENMQPYLVMNYCIALNGVFPSRN